MDFLGITIAESNQTYVSPNVFILPIGIEYFFDETLTIKFPEYKPTYALFRGNGKYFGQPNKFNVNVNLLYEWLQKDVIIRSPPRFKIDIRINDISTGQTKLKGVSDRITGINILDENFLIDLKSGDEISIVLTKAKSDMEDYILIKVNSYYRFTQF